jgi:hypothetical protein
MWKGIILWAVPQVEYRGRHGCEFEFRSW